MCMHKHELYFLNAVQIGCSSIIICYSVINNSLTSKTVIKTIFEVKLSTVWKRCIKLVYALCCNMHVYINLCYPIAISLKIISVSSTNAILRCPSWLFMALKKLYKFHFKTVSSHFFALCNYVLCMSDTVFPLQLKEPWRNKLWSSSYAAYYFTWYLTSCWNNTSSICWIIQQGPVWLAYKVCYFSCFQC